MFGIRAISEAATDSCVRECGLLRYAGFMDEKKGAEDRRIPAGLCVDCIHNRSIESTHGSVFILCELSLTDPTFPKYPRLPVLSCDGYKKKP